MRDNRFDELERFAPLFEAPSSSFEGFLRRRDRKRRNQRLAAGIVAIAVFAAPVWFVATDGRSGRNPAPADPGPPVKTTGLPDYVIDLDTGVKTLLPEAIIRSAADTGLYIESGEPYARYAASSDGSLLAYVGPGDDGNPQIFTAGIDGSAVRQVTQGPTGASSPAWSPDATELAYVGDASGVGSLFVLEVATGETTRVAREAADPQFTPDGSSLLYSAGSGVLRTVPVGGGSSALAIGPGEGVHDAFSGSLSPDGALVTFSGSGWPDSENGRSRTVHCGPCSFVANADGTERRVIPGGGRSPAGAWSPDGSRIVASGYHSHILVIDVATRKAARVAEGSWAIWLDDHTLLVEA